MNHGRCMRTATAIWPRMQTYFPDWHSAARSMSVLSFSLPLPAITRNSLKRSVESAETSLKAAHKNPFLFGNSCWWQSERRKMPHAAFFQFGILKTDIRGEKRRRRWRKKKRWRLGLVAHTLLSPAWHGHDVLSDGDLKKSAEGLKSHTVSLCACVWARASVCVPRVCVNRRDTCLIGSPLL